jgi:eukaryotic-like serine/threonine-protein kinase
MAIAQGTRLGRYEIRSLLGAGGMGEVYLAQDVTLHRPVALKTLRVDLTTDKDRLQRFEREAHTVSSLNHPNILTIYEIGHQDGIDFIVTEFIDGSSLGEHLKREVFAIQEVLEIGIQVASALAAAHEAGIVHRDIKPENVMLRRDQLVKVLDFGLAKLSGLEGRGPDSQAGTEELFDTKPGMVLGTPAYMSPEQARGLTLDARTDIWSLGVVLYNMVTGKLPFAGQTMSDVLVAILSAEPPVLTRFAPAAPPELERIIMKALRKSQEERYQAVQDLGLDLKNLKKKLEFEDELQRSGGGAQVSYNASGEHMSPEPTVALPVTVEGAPYDTRDSDVRKTWSARYVLGEVKRFSRTGLLILALAISATVAVVYVAYSYMAGSGNGSINSLAVLPFKNMSDDPEKDYLSDGISESLINRLSQLPGIKVIANSSSAIYKDMEPDPQQVAKALDITGILTGRISQRGDNLSISVELIDARDRTQVWGEQYIRGAADLLAVQAEISREIADKLRLRLTTGQQQQIARRESSNQEAYDFLLKGRFSRARGGVEDRKKAAAFFNQAISLDPACAPAYAELSDIYRSLVGSSVLDSKEYLPKAEAAAMKALELDESLAEAHYALANLKTNAWEWADAEREYKRAVELNPNLALAHRWYASYLRLVGKHDQAISEIKRARELDPLSPGVNATVGYILFNARQYDQAIEGLKNTLGLDGEYPYTYLFLGFTYAAKEMYPEAIAAYKQAIELGLDTPSTQIFLGSACARAGKRDQAQAILKRLQTSKEDVSPGQLAILHTALGDRQLAFTALEKAYKEHDLQLQYLGSDPAFDPLRSDPQFQNLLRRIGLNPG